MAVDKVVSLEAKVLEILSNAYRREKSMGPLESGLYGLITTSDVRDRLSNKYTHHKVADVLAQLSNDGKVDFYGKLEGLGNMNFWAITPEVDETMNSTS